jgi:adenylate cyclase
MALAMQAAFVPIADVWRKRGYSLALGIGISTGFATLGAIGFEGRWDYAVIGSVTNLSARLCGEAKAGEILLERKTLARLEGVSKTEEAGELTLKGFSKIIPAFRLLGVDTEIELQPRVPT